MKLKTDRDRHAWRSTLQQAFENEPSQAVQTWRAHAEQWLQRAEARRQRHRRLRAAGMVGCLLALAVTAWMWRSRSGPALVEQRPAAERPRSPSLKPEAQFPRPKRDPREQLELLEKMARMRQLSSRILVARLKLLEVQDAEAPSASSSPAPGGSSSRQEAEYVSAALALNLADRLLERPNMKGDACRELRFVVEQFPQTPAADVARARLARVDEAL